MCEKSQRRSRRDYPATYTEYLEGRAFTLELDVERLRNLLRQKLENRKKLVPRHEISSSALMDFERATESPVTRVSMIDSELGDGTSTAFSATTLGT